jgi:hypothetical protein
MLAELGRREDKLEKSIYHLSPEVTFLLTGVSDVGRYFNFS